MSVLWVDSRVGSRELLVTLRKQGIDAQFAMLDSADFCFTGNGPDGDCEVGIERKALSDLVDSLRSGRLHGVSTETHDSQLDRMLATYDFVWLLVEGGYTTDRRGRLVTGHRSRPVSGGFSEDSLNKAILSLDLRGGMRVWQTANAAQSARWVASVFRSFTDKPWSGHSTMHTLQRGTESVVPVSTFRDMVMRIPGVGFAASKAVETFCARQIDEPSEHPSLARMLRMTLSEWEMLEVPTPAGPRKLGTSKAIKILEHLQRLR